MNFDFSHGGQRRSASQPASDGLESTTAKAIDVSSPFGYLFPSLQEGTDAKLPAENSAAVIEKLRALAEAMVESSDTEENNSTIPTGYTYWGQFIDHDITATQNDSGRDIFKADFEPLAADAVVASMKNLRRPVLDLDSVYGDGPEGEASHFYEDGVKLKTGSNAPFTRQPIPDSDLGVERDLPRIPDDDETDGKKAIIGDSRNDENTIISQFHLAFLKFHNAIVAELENEAGDAGGTGDAPEETQFEKARRLTTWHYQWLVVHDYLKTVTLPGVVDKILFSENTFPTNDDEIFMPLEFSVAAYRFGHSMVRSEYDFNLNFGRHDNGDDNHTATFAELFIFTATGDFFGAPTLPTNWIIQWERFFNHHSPLADRFARKIDTNIAMPITNLTNDVKEEEDRRRKLEIEPPTLSMTEREITLHLAVRNLLRSYFLGMPTGQSVANALGVTALTADELKAGNSDALNSALENDQVNFLEKTPLWYYILKEAEVQANGNSLGEVGSHIVAETLIGMLRHDPNSYINNQWDPSQGRLGKDGKPITTIVDMLKFADVMVSGNMEEMDQMEETP